MIKQLTAIDDVIRYQIGSIIIALQWVAVGAYTVVTTRGGIDRIEDNCGAYPTEHEARAVARMYAQMYKAEEQLVAGINANMDATDQRRDATQLTEDAREIVASGQGWNAFRQSASRTAAPVTDTMRQVLDSADSNGWIPAQGNIRQLLALAARGKVHLQRGTGKDRRVTGGWVVNNRKGIAA